MRVQSLSFGIIVGRDDFKVILRDNGYFQILEDSLISKVNPEDFVFFLPNKEGKCSLVVPLCEFDYFENMRCTGRDDYDPILFKDNGGLCVPKEALLRSNSFIVNNGSGYQYIVYYKQDETAYAGWTYSYQEQTIINAFFKNKMYLKDTFDINQRLCDIDKYLDELVVDSIIDSFTIENEETFICRPGKDDYYYVKKVYKEVAEPYINRLFPHKSECIYEDSGFCTAESMSIHPPKRPYIEEEEELKIIAKEKYNKEEHRRFLIEEMMWEYRIDIIERCENNNYQNSIFSRAIKKFIDVDRWKIYENDYEEYLTHLCDIYNSALDSSKKAYIYFSEEIKEIKYSSK